MKTCYLPAGLPVYPRQLLASCSFLLVLLLAVGLGRAQGQGQAPPWELARVVGSGSSNSSSINASAVDASGNVFVTGYFFGSVTFGSTVLTTTGQGMFVAKWDVVAQTYTWAVSNGGGDGVVGGSIAVSGAAVYVAGTFGSGAPARIAGQTLQGAGRVDFFVAKYIDTSTGHTSATSSVADGWATSGGGNNYDAARGVAVNGRDIYVTGHFTSASNAYIAGQLLPGAGGYDVFVAKYVDTSTGLTPATSSFANGWVVSGGGTDQDYGTAIAVSGRNVFVTGDFTSNSNARIAGQLLPGAGGHDMFLAKYVDTSTGNMPATSSFANGWATSGGGTDDDAGEAVAVSGAGIFVTGMFGSIAGARFAGQALAGAGLFDMFLAKYVDTSTGNTPATSSFANGWATSGGGTDYDAGTSVVVSGNSLFVSGRFKNNTTATIASQAFSTGGGFDVFVAKYTDTSTGNTPSTSSYVNNWAVSGGNSIIGGGTDVVVSGQQLYITGAISGQTNFGPLSVGISGPISNGFLARLTDPALPLAATAATARPAFTLAPNPARDAVQVRGAAPGSVLHVRDALGRLRATAPAAADGTARVSLAGLPPGVYVVQSGGRAQRLVVE